MKLKQIGFFCLFFAFAKANYAQTTLEAFTTADNLTLEGWFFKPLNEDYKLTLFSLNEAIVEYNTEETTFVSYNVIGHNVWKGFGPVVGARILEGRGSALAGIQWAKASEKFLITTNFTTEVRDNPFYELYILAQYKFPIDEKISFFSQLQNSTNFNNDRHDFSFQRLRVGISWKKYQVGAGLNTFQFGDDWDFEIDPGIFVRVEF
ncbi:hypothetical protein J8281_02740 [Aquimarina sp. U1-2]|uniref:hypothetical protein n=1 Tax=Aquimarina sp. U1-2 TaxID=2823141 RepID=UPI001AECE9EE|nr:hypothetical protein [Aquimarina sp. U1-2]MBP2831094.1 hypothetical protein [Aquimarina sp. U1-2]